MRTKHASFPTLFNAIPPSRFKSVSLAVALALACGGAACGLSAPSLAHQVSDSAAVNAPRREVVFIAGDEAEIPVLLAGVKPGREVHVLDPHRDGLAQMAEILRGENGLTAIHLISHGAVGQLNLGALTLDNTNLDAHAPALAQIGAALKAGGDFLIYGCNAGHGARGRDFVEKLGKLSGADVAASSDPTGNPARGGNWTLEVQRGPIQASNALRAATRAAYSGVLSAAPTATAGAEYVDVSGAAGATVKLYLTNGTLQATGTVAAGGTYRFNNVLPNALWYYVTQDDGSGESGNTPFFNVSLRIPSATPGTELVDVSNVSASATIKLYRVDGTLISSSPTDQGGGVYRFSNVTPSSLGFYVIQSVGGRDSDNTPFFGIALRTPSISAGIRQIDASNIYPGATVTLYASNGTALSSSPTDVGGGVFRFSNVTPLSSGHYVMQSINGVNSTASSLAVTTASAPTFVGGVSSLTVNAFPNATNFRDQLAVSDIDVNQTLTWSVTSPPSHGTLSGFPATATSHCDGGICGTAGSTVSRPSAAVSYTPASGYTGSDSFTITVSDGGATASRTISVGVNASSGSTASPADSAALSAALNDPAVATINLSSGMTYQIYGSEINRALTINGNNAVIEALGGMGQSFDNQTIFHLGMPDAGNNRRYRGNLFWRVSGGGHLTASNLTLRNAATTANAQGLTGLFSAIFLTGQSNATLSGISFENFWFTNSKFMEQNNLATAQGLYASYSDMSYGVYADYDFQGNLSVTGSTFGSSNAFRDAVHLYNSQSATISNNTFTGTAHPARLRAADGFENGIQLNGGNSTITGNTISGYQAHLNSNYYSAGITGVAFFAGASATITDNTINNCSSGFSVGGGWQSYQAGSELTVNGYSLINNPGLAGFSLGNRNTLGNGVHGPKISLYKDQNDSAAAYNDPFLVFTSRTATTATLGLASGTTPAINSTAFTVQQSLDGITWNNATVTPSGSLNATNTSFTVSGLDAATRYYFRLNDSDSGSNSVGWSNLIALPTLTLGQETETTLTVGFSAPGGSGVRIEKSTDGGATWTTATLQSAITATSTSATVIGLAGNTSYLLRINGSGTSGWGYSVPLGATTRALPDSGVYGNTFTTTLPTGGGTAAPTGGQTVIVTDNGSNGSTITMPSPTTTSGGATTVNTIKVELPNNTGAVNVASNSEGTKLGVQNTVLPGTNTTVTTVTVDQGSASFTATKKDQPLAGLKNGIIVVSGTDSSKVTVDTTGGAAQIGIATSDTIIVPKGIPNVSGTVVELPNPQTNGGAAPTVTVKAGDQTLTVKASQADTTMTFQVVDIGGVQTPVLTVTGIATVGIAGESQPLVSIGGNVITSGNSNGNVGKLKCNTLVEASTETAKDIVQVNTCYIVLAPGTFSALSGGVGNSFAAIKDGIVWAGETAEFDKNGAVIGAYLGTKGGTTSAVGDDIVPGGGKFSAGFTNNAFIPRLTGSPLRLNEAKLDESLFGVFNTALNATTLPATPSQSAQGILNFQVSGGADSLQKAQSALTFDLVGDLVSIFPSKRIKVDTARADGISVSNEGNVEVATGGLITTFVPTVADPQGFAADIATLFPGAVSEMRWNGSWKVTTSDGRMFVGRPQWGIQSSASGNTFNALADGTVTYSANGRTQVLFPDFHDYTTLLATFSKELNDPNLKVAPRMNGSVQATVNGRTYLLYPQWTLLNTDQASGKPSWWLDNGVVYIKNADGTAQGFGVK